MQIHEILKDIKVGMPVYDSTNNNFTSVAFIHAPADAVDKSSELHEMLPSNVSASERQRLINDGFIRMENSLFSGASFAEFKDIDRVEDDSVYLKLKQNEVIRE